MALSTPEVLNASNLGSSELQRVELEVPVQGETDELVWTPVTAELVSPKDEHEVPSLRFEPAVPAVGGLWGYFLAGRDPETHRPARAFPVRTVGGWAIASVTD